MQDSKAKVVKSSPTRQKAGGRVKGTPNKSTEYIQRVIEEKGFCPILTMVMIAQNDWEGLGYESPEYERQGFQGVTFSEPVITLDHRIVATKTLISYLYPKRKAIEHSVAEGSSKIVLAYSEESLKKAAQTDEKG